MSPSPPPEGDPPDDLAGDPPGAVRTEADRRRFEAIFRATSRPLLGYALRRVDEPAAAADVVAETLLVAWRRLEDVPGGDDTRPWLFGVARGVLANHRRGAGRRHRLAEALRDELRTSVLSRVDQDAEATNDVAAAMDRMEDADREMLRLTAWEGLTPSQVALALSIPAATARTRLHRARGRLRRHLEEIGGERTGPAGHEEDDGHPPAPSERGRA